MAGYWGGLYWGRGGWGNGVVLEENAGTLTIDVPIEYDMVSMTGIVYSTNYGIINIESPISIDLINMSGYSYNIGSLEITTHIPIIKMYSIGNLIIATPVPTIELGGYVLNIGNVSIMTPMPIFNFESYMPIMGGLDVNIPMPTVYLIGAITNFGLINANTPFPSIKLTGLSKNLGVLSIQSPIQSIVLNAIITIMGSMSIDTPVPYFVFLGTTSEGLTYVELVVNTENFALSEYTNFDYENLTYFNGKYIGLKSDGIYEIEGDDDYGTAIKALIRFPTIDLYKNFKSRLNEMFYTGRNYGTLQFRIIEDEKTINNYLTKISDGGIHEERIKFGKGHIGRFVILEVFNPNGESFDINSIRILADKIGARLR